MIGGSRNVVIAFNTTSKAPALWRMTPDDVWSSYIFNLRIHGDVVVVPFYGNKTMVIDIATGHTIQTLPLSGIDARTTCVFDGLTSDKVCWFSHRFIFSSTIEAGIESICRWARFRLYDAFCFDHGSFYLLSYSMSCIWLYLKCLSFVL